MSIRNEERFERLWFNRTHEELEIKTRIVSLLNDMNDPLTTMGEKVSIAQKIQEAADELVAETRKWPVLL